jgi:hypothetical protein
MPDESRFHRYRSACDEIVRVCAKHGITLSPEQAFLAWEKYSDDMCAGWLLFDAGSEESKEAEILQAVRSWLDTSAEPSVMAVLEGRLKLAEQENARLRAALQLIADMDYRGNRPAASSTAYAALTAPAGSTPPSRSCRAPRSPA